MSFSDNLENQLKNLESRDERDQVAAGQGQQRRQAQRARTLASAPFAEKLRHGPFTSELMTHVTRIGHGLRTKVSIVWLGGALRFEAREHRMELHPTPEGITGRYFVNGNEVRQESVDLEGNAEALAKNWLDTVGPRPAPEPLPEIEE
jgi:hypothetical protein